MRQYLQLAPGWLSAGQDADTEERTAHVKHVPTHYMGAIVTANPVTVTPPRSSVIDGQQRLLTSWILLVTCRDLALKRIGTAAARKAEADDLKVKFKSYLSNVGHQGLDAWRILPQKLDQTAFRHLMLETREPGQIKMDNVGLTDADSPRLMEAYNFFLREMSRRKLPDKAPFEMLAFRSLFPLDPAILEYTIMNRLHAIKLVAGSNDDPNMIFESLNTKGRDLQQVDLIKNFLYLSLADDADEVYSSYWQPMENVLRPAELEKFSWASLVSRGENVLQKRTYEAVQRILRKQGSAGTKKYVIDLHTESIWFERFIRTSKEPDMTVRSAIEDLLASGGSTALPLILYCYRRYQATNSVTPFISAMSAIESFLVRRLVSGESTNNLNSMFGSMCSRLNSVGDKFSAGDDLVEDIQRVLSSRLEDLPTNEQVEQGVKSVDFYKAQGTTQRILVLRRIDQWLKKSAVKLDYAVSDKSIEHIFPQTPASESSKEVEDWRAQYDDSSWEIMCARAHTMPNLTLLTPSENSAVGRKVWKFKRSSYAAAGYPMTFTIAEDFAAPEVWGPEQLDQRAASLADLVNTIWPRIVVAPREVEDTIDNAVGEVLAEEDPVDTEDDDFNRSLLEDEVSPSDG